MQRVLLTDMDWTILESDAAAAALVKSARELGWNAPEEEVLAIALNGDLPESYSKAKFWELFRGLRTDFAPRVCEGAQESLERFRRAGFRVVLISDAPDKTVATCLAYTGLTSLFDLVVPKERGGIERAPKPALTAGLWAREMLDHGYNRQAPTIFYFLGDSDWDVGAACNLQEVLPPGNIVYPCHLTRWGRTHPKAAYASNTLPRLTDIILGATPKA